MIEVTDLTKRFGPNTAIESLTFSVAPGEILGFLGPNGAGKTTTMRILTGFMPASAGTARVAGFDVDTQSMDVRRRVGYLPESVPVYREGVVRDYLRFVADVKRVPVPGIRAHIEGVMERVGLSAVAGRIVGRLSRGFRQRVGLAQALIGDPEVLVLDEPTVGLDPAQVVEVRELIRSLAGRRTVILSTHILPEVSQVCTRVLIINRGRIVAQGTADELTGRFGGGRAFRVRVAGDARLAAERLRALAGVTLVSLDPPDDAAAALRVEAGGADFVEADLPRALLDAGLGLRELTPLSSSLEEIFLSVVREAREPEPAVAATPAAPGSPGPSAGGDSE